MYCMWASIPHVAKSKGKNERPPQRRLPFCCHCTSATRGRAVTNVAVRLPFSAWIRRSGESRPRATVVWLGLWGKVQIFGQGCRMSSSLAENIWKHRSRETRVSDIYRLLYIPRAISTVASGSDSGVGAAKWWAIIGAQTDWTLERSRNKRVRLTDLQIHRSICRSMDYSP